MIIFYHQAPGFFFTHCYDSHYALSKYDVSWWIVPGTINELTDGE